MSTCARCGLQLGMESVNCGDWDGGEDFHISERLRLTNRVDCRDRQIAAQAALLRSVTGKLEKASQYCEDGMALTAKAQIDAVLEALS